MSRFFRSLVQRFAAALFFLALLSVGISYASPLPPRILDPKSYVSASGQYILEVDPTELYGRGPGRYRLLRDGHEVWSKTFSFTFAEAVVLADGSCSGYAYDHGREGFALEGGYKAGMGTLHVVFLNPEGNIRRDEVTSRKFSTAMHSPAEPLVRGIVLQEDQDRLTIRIWNEKRENWWVYRCSDGRRLRSFDLAKAIGNPAAPLRTESVKGVPGRPLRLIQWTDYDDSRRQITRFMLVDESGRPVWSQEQPLPPRDAEEPDTRKLWAAVERLGLIFDSVKPGEFELWRLPSSERVRFRVSADPAQAGAWRVEELSTEPFSVSEEPAPVHAAGENRPLPSLGTFSLVSPPPESPLSDIFSFAFDAEGRIGLLQKKGTVFTLLDGRGKVLAEVPLPTTVHEAPLGRFFAAPVGGGKWVIAASEQKQEAQAWAWWFDPAAPQLGKPIPIICPTLEALAGDGQGGFVVLANRYAQYSLTHELHAFDSVGGQTWMAVANSDQSPETLFSPKDVAVTTRGEVAVLDVIRHTIQLFEHGGKYLRMIDLKKSWGWEPRYPSGLVRDFDGGFVVEDYKASRPFVRMRADGKLRAPVRPKRSDGSPFDTNFGLQIAPDGRQWISDGQALLRLNAKDTVDFTIGKAPTPENLDDIAAVATGPQGHLYAVDERTGAVHIFDSEGRNVRICLPATGDFRENLRDPHLTVADDGTVYLGVDEDSTRKSGGILQFNPQGKRLGFQLLFGGVRQEWIAQPGSDRVLVQAYQVAGLVGPKRQLLKKIERRADRRWLDSITDSAFASDGSLAILAGRSDSFGTDMSVTIFTREGEPVRTFPRTGGWSHLLGFNGTHLVFQRGGVIEITDAHGAPVQSFPTPAENDDEWLPVLTRNGRELWMVNRARHFVQRLAMP